LFVTQTWVPSEDTPPGILPTGIVRMTPVAAAEDTPTQHAVTATAATSTPAIRPLFKRTSKPCSRIRTPFPRQARDTL
jgi:hypothetical protein